jgi:hypothetical protein
VKITKHITDFTAAFKYHLDGIEFLRERYSETWDLPTGFSKSWDLNSKATESEVLTEIGATLSSADELIMASWYVQDGYAIYFLQIRNVEIDLHWFEIAFDFKDEYLAVEFKLAMS